MPQLWQRLQDFARQALTQATVQSPGYRLGVFHFKDNKVHWCNINIIAKISRGKKNCRCPPATTEISVQLRPILYQTKILYATLLEFFFRKNLFFSVFFKKYFPKFILHKVVTLKSCRQENHANFLVYSSISFPLIGFE